MRQTRRDRFADLAVIPAVSVAFLMLAFLLLTATLHSARPTDIALPVSLLGTSSGSYPVLVVDRHGAVSFDTWEGEDALERAAKESGGILVLADRDTLGTDLAKILARLRSLGSSSLSVGVLRP